MTQQVAREQKSERGRGAKDAPVSESNRRASKQGNYFILTLRTNENERKTGSAKCRKAK
jgi:hypothetical protein